MARAEVRLQPHDEQQPALNPAATAADAGVTRAPWPWRLYAALTAYLGLPIIAVWIGVALASTALLPDLGTNAAFGLVDLVPSNTASVRAQADETRLFGSSLADSQSLVVESDRTGLPPASVAALGRQALAIDRSHAAAASRPDFALPLVNLARVVPGSHGTATTAVTYLLFSAAAQPGDITAGSQRYAAAASRPPGSYVGVTGPLPAETTEGDTIENGLVLLEVVTVAVIAVLVGLIFRSPIAPLVPLAASVVAYLATRHVLGWAARSLGMHIPSQLAPIMVVLILGVVTDYSVFTLTGVRARLAAGERRTVALRYTAAAVVPLVMAAALTVAAGTVALLGADLDFFHAVGPGMAIAVVVSGLVSISFVPSLVAVLGRLVFWPSLRAQRAATPSGGGRMWVARILSRRSGAAVAAAACVAILFVAASGLGGMRFGSNVVSGLPADSEARQAALAASGGFGAGIVAPTTLLLQAPGITSRGDALSRVAAVIASSPGVAGVVGAEDLPANVGASLFRSPQGSAVRMVVVFEQDPYDAPALADFATLKSRVSGALPGAGIGGASASWSGATATASEAVADTEANIWRVALLAALLMYVVLAIYFRALLAPLLLIASSALAVAACLGLLVDLFQGPLQYPDVTFFVPLTAGVLLVSLGADYSVFVMGRIWEEMRARPITGALVAALPRASRAVSIAAAILAASFAVLALVPVQPFREIAFIMSAGVVIDAFLVRSLLLPALLVLAGRSAFWPHRSAVTFAGAPGRRR